jgi:hypothetical protein
MDESETAPEVLTVAGYINPANGKPVTGGEYGTMFLPDTVRIVLGVLPPSDMAMPVSVGRFRELPCINDQFVWAPGPALLEPA